MLNIEKIPLPLLDLVKFLLAQASKALMGLETVRPTGRIVLVTNE